MRFVRQSTAVDLPIGPFVSSDDGFTAATALTIAQADIRLKKNGGAWAQKSVATGGTHEENGYYEISLSATDTDTLGLLRLAVAETGALPLFEDFMVMPANVWDSFFAADNLDVSVVQWLGTSVGAGTAGVPNVDVTRISNAAVATGTAQLGVNVVNFGGAAGTFASGRPEVNTSHAAGTAWNSGAISASTLAADTLTAAKVAADVGTEFATAFFGTAIPGAFGAGTAGSRLGKLPDATAGAAGGVFIAGTNAATTITTGLTTTFTGNLTGSVGSVSGLTASNLDATVSSRLAPTVAGRTLDVSATGEAGVDWANVGSASSIQTLSGTTVGTVTTVTGGATAAGVSAIQADVDDVQARLPAALVGGRIDASVGSIASNAITAAATAADFGTELAAAIWAFAGSDPSAVPTVTAAMSAKLDWLCALARNKRTTSTTTETLRNDADSASVATAAISDDGTTFTRDEWT